MPRRPRPGAPAAAVGGNGDPRDALIHKLQQDVVSLRATATARRRGGEHTPRRDLLHTARSHRSERLSTADTSRLPSARVQIVQKPADGSCLFHSMAHSLNDGTRGPQLRAEIAGFIKVRACSWVLSLFWILSARYNALTSSFCALVVWIWCAG